MLLGKMLDLTFQECCGTKYTCIAYDIKTVNNFTIIQQPSNLALVLILVCYSTGYITTTVGGDK